MTKAVDLEPKVPKRFRDRGDIYYAKNDGTKALADYSQAITLDPQSDAVYALRAKTQRQLLRNYAASVADYSEALKLKPGESSYYLNRGDAHYDRAFSSRRTAPACGRYRSP